MPNLNARLTLIAVSSLAAFACSSANDDEEVGETSTSITAAGISARNASGTAQTISTNRSIDMSNEFFQDLGSNGRRCVSCHESGAGWTITPSRLKAVFEATHGGVDADSAGAGAIFRTNDGSNSPLADVSTLEARRAAYNMLLTKGLIRVGIGIPDGAEFELVAVDDPYGYASTKELSLFRRPLPTTNLKFLSTVMWDGRETFPGQNIEFDLAHQANDATLGHARGLALTAAQSASIVAFESALVTAQISDHDAGDLEHGRSGGGPSTLASQPFYIGINDLFGDRKTGAPFNPKVFTLFDAWDTRPHGGTEGARAAVARGQALFNSKPINITAVSGINDEAAFGSPPAVQGTCTTCHNSPNVGDHSVPAPLNIGIASALRRTPDMPLYTLRNTVSPTRETVQTTDPGRALITGKWKDIGRFKGPILRGLAARPPYFHNGSAPDLRTVVDFYDSRFGIGLSADEKSDLVSFLRCL
jgi:cytochrome c peroxidase